MSDSELKWRAFCEEIVKEVTSLPSFSPLDYAILCIDDEGHFVEVLEDQLQPLGLKIIGSTSPDEAIALVKRNQNRLVLILSDFKMPEMTGFEFRDEILKFASSIPFFILSSFVDREMALKGLQLKISGFLKKPLNLEEMAIAIAGDVKARIQSLKEDQELLRGFVEEAKTILDKSESFILELEENPQNRELVHSVFGLIHTIKGASGFFEPKTLHHFIHRFEDVLKKAQTGLIPVTPKLVSISLKALDTAKSLLNEFEQGSHQDHDLDALVSIFSESELANDAGIGEGGSKTEVHSSAEKQTDPIHSGNHQAKESSVKVELSLLDEFLRASGEMTVVRNMLNKVVSSLESKYSLDRDVSQLGELMEEFHKVNCSVQSKITEVRKVSLKSVFKPIPRLIRDVASKTKKLISFELSGEDLRVDNSIAEVLNASLTHLIRNSIDHGIESPEERTKLGKAEKGFISVRAFLRNDFVIVEIRDDGKGINTDVVRKKAIAQGLVPESEALNMQEGQLQMLIFESGFSTAETTTDISGRGVGTSAVKASVEGIGGKIQIESERLKGTCFILSLPVPKTVQIKNCLFVRVKDSEFGIAQDQIVHLVHIDEVHLKKSISVLEGGMFYRSEDDQAIPLVNLSNILKLENNRTPSSEFKIVIVKMETGRIYGLIVEEIREFEDAVVKPMISCIRNIRMYAGATFLPDGSVGLLLDVDGIGETCRIQSSQARLVVDSGLRPNSPQLNSDWILFHLDTQGTYAIARSSVFRIEEFEIEGIRTSGDFKLISYRDQVMSILNLSEFFKHSKSVLEAENEQTKLSILVIKHNKQYLGFQVKAVLDIACTDHGIEPPLVEELGIQGNLIIGSQIVTVLDPVKFLSRSKLFAESNIHAA